MNAFSPPKPFQQEFEIEGRYCTGWAEYDGTTVLLGIRYKSDVVGLTLANFWPLHTFDSRFRIGKAAWKQMRMVCRLPEVDTVERPVPLAIMQWVDKVVDEACR